MCVKHPLHGFKTWRMQMALEIENVTNGNEDRENQLSPEQMDVLFKWLCVRNILSTAAGKSNWIWEDSEALLNPRPHMDNLG